ncbi:MAG: 30S ribosomal protein S20 [Pleurocapsa minor GSE-CHR-MK-17-07R]|jgi:small subunit ribosomal protein S20|nr:30S ribosomal protein S20 [Pleurocapsa minor GSE-CHR-MK 17-07R]
MANHKSAIKRIGQSEKRRAYNRVYRSRTRTFVKRARTLQAGKDLNAAAAAAVEAIVELDKAVSKGVLHKNNAARRKSRLMKALNAARAK